MKPPHISSLLVLCVLLWLSACSSPMPKPQSSSTTSKPGPVQTSPGRETPATPSGEATGNQANRLPTSVIPADNSRPRVIQIEVPQAESSGNPLAEIDPEIPLETSVTPKVEPIVVGTTKPYIYNGETVQPMSSITNFSQTGHASWYGKKFHGLKTASGETYNMYKLSAAHKTLPIPSYVRVTNLDNQKSVVVRVNDRGPFAHGRILDLSYAAAKQLDMLRSGSAKVQLSLIDPTQGNTDAPIVSPATTASATSAPGETETTVTSLTEPGVYLQLGAFAKEDNANRLLTRLQQQRPESQGLLNKVYNGTVFQVVLGPYPDHALAEQMAAELRDQLQLPALLIVR